MREEELNRGEQRKPAMGRVRDGEKRDRGRAGKRKEQELELTLMLRPWICSQTETHPIPPAALPPPRLQHFHASDVSTWEAKAENCVYEGIAMFTYPDPICCLSPVSQNGRICLPKWGNLPPDIFIGTAITLETILGRAHIFMISS